MEGNPVNRVDPSGRQSTGTGTGIGGCPPGTIPVPVIHFGPLGAKVDYECVKLPFGLKPPSSDSQTQGYCGREYRERQKEEEDDEFCQRQRELYEDDASNAYAIARNLIDLTYALEREENPLGRLIIEEQIETLQAELELLRRKMAERRRLAEIIGCKVHTWPPIPGPGGDAPVPVPVPY